MTWIPRCQGIWIGGHSDLQAGARSGLGSGATESAGVRWIEDWEPWDHRTERWDPWGSWDLQWGHWGHWGLPKLGSGAPQQRPGCRVGHRVWWVAMGSVSQQIRQEASGKVGEGRAWCRGCSRKATEVAEGIRSHFFCASGLCASFPGMTLSEHRTQLEC